MPSHTNSLIERELLRQVVGMLPNQLLADLDTRLKGYPAQSLSEMRIAGESQHSFIPCDYRPNDLRYRSLDRGF